jgi:hypothetical protein
MSETSPAGIRALVKEATALEAQQRAGISLGIPALVGNLAVASIRSLMRSKDLTWDQRTTLGALAANGVWPCARMHPLGMCASPLCQRCGAEEDTLYHRAWVCQAIHQARCEATTPAIRAAAAMAGPTSAAFTRGLFPDRVADPVPMLEGDPA